MTLSDIMAPPRTGQPYVYTRRELVEPDWRRFPGWRDVSAVEWRDAQWQRAHCVKNAKQLMEVFGTRLSSRFYEDLAADRRLYATMPVLLTPHIINTMVPSVPDDASDITDALLADPVRRYMLPVASDREPLWCSHPYAERDSLHESEMSVVEGLVHRYPTKVLAELVSTCPQYCGHCTRMDLVGSSTPAVTKAKFELRPRDRQQGILDYLRTRPGIRDVVVSGGDVANVPWPQLESFLGGLLEIETIRDIRLATKALAGLPQHWLQPQVLAGLGRVAATAAKRAVNVAVHTHVNHAQSVTPLVAEAAGAVLDAGVRDVRNQGVILRGVNATFTDLLDLCFAAHGEANILPYYFYLCDMIPNSEHWRIAVWEAQQLQEEIMGYLPGYATPRIVCDVPYVGKRWVHQVVNYDRELGISHWSKNYRTPFEAAQGEQQQLYPFYDPISTLPPSGQKWWRDSSDREMAV